MNQKLVRLILKEVQGGKKMRYEVTNRLKNYRKEERSGAIQFCLSKGLVTLSECAVEGVGRNPVYVSITDKGEEHLKEIGDQVSDGSIWSV